MDESFLKALAETVRDQVIRKNEVRVPGLGSFIPEHRIQQQKQYNDGRVVMKPPKDILTFSPESKQEV